MLFARTAYSDNLLAVLAAAKLNRACWAWPGAVLQQCHVSKQQCTSTEQRSASPQGCCCMATSTQPEASYIIRKCYGDAYSNDARAVAAASIHL